MGYTSLNPTVEDARHESFENIEMIQHSTNSPPETLYAPPPPHPPRTSDVSIKDTKALFSTEQPPIERWPIRSQQVATLTPRRTVIIVFDVILASTPIMFIGEYASKADLL